ncbi:MAG TPA: hypothetical protein DGT21_21920 [Armatimonadetes bacterium]|jgi:F-type H+-transporting ATPase subunit c|nr:hypothetical protein [Armatimonadota bacterium]
MDYGTALALGVSLGVSIAVLTASLAQAKAAVAALEAIARQPDIVGATQRLLILSLAFIESLVIYALLVFFMLQGKLAPVADIVSKGAGH